MVGLKPCGRCPSVAERVDVDRNNSDYFAIGQTNQQPGSTERSDEAAVDGVLMQLLYIGGRTPPPFRLAQCGL